MEGMRGFAALLVFFVHFDSLFRPYFRANSFASVLVDVAGNLGHTAVDLFFLLSGFLIYGILIKRPQSIKTFILRRLRRLYPVFLVVLGLYLALSIIFPTYSKLPHSLSQALIVIGANVLMMPGMTRITAIITVAWSLSYEWFFYLTLPLVIAVFGLRRWNPWHRVAFFLSLVIAKYVLWSYGMSGHIRMVLFGAGIILWELVEQGIPRFLNRWTEYAVALAFVANILAIGIIGAKHGEPILVLSKVPHFYTPSLFISLLLFTLYATFFNGFLRRAFSWDYLRWMGNISYSYYLIHGLALQGVKLVVNYFFPPAERSALFDVLLFVACVAFTILCGALLFLFVEKPLSWTIQGSDARNRGLLRANPANARPPH